MSAVLQSYASGRWFSPSGGDPLLDAATGEEVARISSRGLDLAAMVEHARVVGGPAVRKLTFHERAATLKDLARSLSADKEALHALSLKTGATPRDGMVDIDFGLATLFAYADMGRRELPSGTVVLDGDHENLGKSGAFLGQHVYTSRLGVAVQINAFNFPVWGMLEKLAPAFLAGLPSIVKPASQTAYLAEAVARRIVESGILPEGSFQFLCGSAGDLLDHLGEQDSVGFTGSARTAAILRQHPSVLHRGLRLGVEADSLNCSILGPDVTPDDPEFALFVKGVVTEMTAKAGQKCTAIRRVIVPSTIADSVTASIADRLAKTIVGHPGAEGVRMGALASVAQRDEVRTAVETLSASADIVFGDPGKVEVVDADAERGAFMSPVLLRAHPGAGEVHEVEPFGPVSTVITYETLDEAIELAARGRGSLAGSLITHDPSVAREVVLGLAPWHGRILVLDRDDAAESTGHGAPLPALIHGGPGRAGGGEEMGGIRGVLHHMQRTAIQGSPDMVTAITGRWTTGSAQHEDGIHPYRKTLADLAVGDTIRSESRQVTAAEISHFAKFTGDTFYVHTDPEAAAAHPIFDGIVAHGYHVLALAAGLVADEDPGPVLGLAGLDDLRLRAPVKADDSISVTMTVKQITQRPGADHGQVSWETVIVNQNDSPVATYVMRTLVATTWPPVGDGGRA